MYLSVLLMNALSASLISLIANPVSSISSLKSSRNFFLSSAESPSSRYRLVSSLNATTPLDDIVAAPSAIALLSSFCLSAAVLMPESHFHKAEIAARIAVIRSVHPTVERTVLPKRFHPEPSLASCFSVAANSAST